MLVQCFSAVVGPNGSGKSNVIDAMLFVFGKRAKQVLLLPPVQIFSLIKRAKKYKDCIALFSRNFSREKLPWTV